MNEPGPAAVGPDGLLRIITLDLEELIRIARRRSSRPMSDTECRCYLHTLGCPTQR